MNGPVPYSMKAKATRLAEGPDETLEPAEGPTDAERRGRPPFRWPFADRSKLPPGPDKSLIPAVGPTDPEHRGTPPFLWAPPARFIDSVHLDPDIALWPQVIVSIWPFAGHPTTGSWPKGWISVDNTATLWICTVGGSPGTWETLSSSSGSVRPNPAQSGPIDLPALYVPPPSGGDDSGAIQAVLDIANANAPTFFDIIFDSGTYEAHGLTWYSNSKLSGQGSIASPNATPAAGGTTIRNNAGSAGGTLITVALVAANGSNWGIFDLALAGDGSEEAAHLVDLTAVGVDEGNRLSGVHFHNASSDAILVGNTYPYVNLHWDHLRFDDIGGFAVNAELAETQGLSSFLIEDFTYSVGAGVEALGVIQINQEAQSVGLQNIVALKDGRIELDGSGAGAESWAVFTDLGGYGGGVMWHLEDVPMSLASGGSLLNRIKGTGPATGGEILTCVNVTQGGLTAIVSGDIGANNAIPPVNEYGWSYLWTDLSNAIVFPHYAPAEYIGGLTSGDFLDFIQVAAGTYPVLSILLGGGLAWGPGSGAVDTKLVRGGVGFLAAPFLVKAGIPADSDFAAVPPNGTVAIDSSIPQIYARIAGTWTAV
jgi:hypothetical protein